MTRLRDVLKHIFDSAKLFARALTSSTPLIGSFGRFGSQPEENLEPIGLSEIKAQIVSLQSEATIVRTFLQFLAFDLVDNLYTLYTRLPS